MSAACFKVNVLVKTLQNKESHHISGLFKYRIMQSNYFSGYYWYFGYKVSCIWQLIQCLTRLSRNIKKSGVMFVNVIPLNRLLRKTNEWYIFTKVLQIKSMRSLGKKTKR